MSAKESILDCRDDGFLVPLDPLKKRSPRLQVSKKIGTQFFTERSALVAGRAQFRQRTRSRRQTSHIFPVTIFLMPSMAQTRTNAIDRSKTWRTVIAKEILANPKQIS